MRKLAWDPWRTARAIYLISSVRDAARLGEHDCEENVRLVIREIDREFANARGQR